MTPFRTHAGTGPASPANRSARSRTPSASSGSTSASSRSADPTSRPRGAGSPRFSLALRTHSLNAAVRQAARIHRVDLQQLRGRRRLDAIVRLYDPLFGLTESDFEAIFLARCKSRGLPTPTPQKRFQRRRADFTFEEARLVVECDSRRWHDNDVSHLEDRQKERRIKARGYELLRFTWAEVVYEPARVAAELKEALERRRHELLGSSWGS